MANVAAAKFLKQLIAAFCRYPPTADTKELYLQKLSRWKLTQPQWDEALDILVNSSSIEELPMLAEIYPVLKTQAEGRQMGENLASVHFDMPNGHHYIERVMSVASVWVYAPLAYINPRGQRIELRPGRVGKAFLPPKGAMNVDVFPDKPAKPEAHEMLTQAEINDFFLQFRKTNKKIGRVA